MRLVEIRILLNERFRVIDAFDHFKKGTRGQKADDLFQLKTKSIVWNAFVDYSRERVRKRIVNKDIEDLCQKKLLSRTLGKLVEYRDHRRVRKIRTERARFHHKIHSLRKTQRIAFFAILKYAIYRKQLKSASIQYLGSLMFKVFDAFKGYQDTAIKKRESRELVTSFYQCTLAKKALKELLNNCNSKKSHRRDVVAHLRASHLRKLFHSIKFVTDQSKVYAAMQNPSQINACRIWL